MDRHILMNWSHLQLIGSGTSCTWDGRGKQLSASLATKGWILTLVLAVDAAKQGDQACINTAT